MTDFEFLIPRRPLSLQANSGRLQLWKKFVHEEAAKVWVGEIVSTEDLQLTLVYLCEDDPPDTDNIIKPIQDALVGLLYMDDSLVSDVDCHRRFLASTFDLTQLPQLVVTGIKGQRECVYVRVRNSRILEDYL